MSDYTFGYTWYWTHGHLVPATIFGALAAVALWRRWTAWVVAGGAAIAIWAIGGFIVTQTVFGANAPFELPTGSFLARGGGDVLDAGAGSGRATIGVLLARPGARVTALDIYSGHFGIDDNTPARLLHNARVAGGEGRVRVVTGDMRAMPLGDATFDAVVSTFAIDHLDREGVGKALAEVTRVLKPEGEFLLAIINVDGWVRFAYPFPHAHGYFSTPQNRDRWISRIEAAGLRMVETGTRPATLYFLARKPGDQAADASARGGQHPADDPVPDRRSTGPAPH